MNDMNEEMNEKIVKVAYTISFDFYLTVRFYYNII